MAIHVEKTLSENRDQEDAEGQRVEETTGKRPKLVTCDRGYGSGGNYEALEELKITAVIPPPQRVS